MSVKEVRPGSTQPIQRREAQPSKSSADQVKQGLIGKSYDEQVQLLAEGPGRDIQANAAEGVRGGGGALPHLGAIQASFGRHDVSAVQAYTGGAAAGATEAMGAAAYATGNKVAFGDAPDLHTAAHEAAHVVQQRAGVSVPGGVGQSGDRYEQHAEAVASAVVQGKSAEGLLDTMSGGGAQAPVQQKADGAPVQGFLGFGEDEEEESSSDSGGGIGSAIGNAWDGAKQAASDAYDGAKEAASDAYDGAKESAGEAWEATKEGVGQAWDGVKEGAGAVGEGIASGAEAVKDAGSQAWDGIREAGGAAWEAVKGAGGDAWELMKTYGAKSMKELNDILMKLPGMAANKTEAEGDKAPPSIVGTSGKVVIAGEDKTITEGPWGEVSWAPALEIVFKIVSDPEGKKGWKILFWKSDDKEPEDDGGGGTEKTVGPQKDGNQVGIQAEVKKELEGKFLGAKRSVKSSGEATVDLFSGKNKGKLGMGGELEWGDLPGNFAIAAGLDFNILKWETGKPPKLGVITGSAGLKMAPFEWTIPSGKYEGAKAALEVTGKVEIDVNPNELWFAEKLAAAAASLGALPIAMIVGGMLSVGVPLVQIANMENIDEGVGRAIDAGNQVRRYGVDYVDGLRGSFAPTQGGLAAAKWLDEMKAAQGPDAVAKFIQTVDSRSAYSQAAAQAWPRLRQQAIDAYWNAHPLEKLGSLGGYGPKSGGMQALERMLSQVEPTVLKY